MAEEGAVQQTRGASESRGNSGYGSRGGSGDESERDKSVELAVDRRDRVIFHIIMSLGAWYMAMLLTNWAGSAECAPRLSRPCAVSARSPRSWGAWQRWQADRQLRGQHGERLGQDRIPVRGARVSQAMPTPSPVPRCRWLAFLLFCWSVAAPLVCPNREFG